MDIKLALFALTEIISSLIIGVSILFLTYKFFRIYARKKMGLEKNNDAFRIFIAGALFAVGYTISGIIQPIITSFRLLSQHSSNWMIVESLMYALFYVTLAFIISTSVSFFGLIFYEWLTPVDESKEFKDNNIGVAIITATIIITLAIMTRSGVILLIESFIPYPYLPPN